MENIRIKTLLVIAVFILTVQSADTSAAGAGVLVSTVHKNQVYVLLADHKKPSQVARGWSTLGGTIKEGESELQAAVREVVEESAGVLSPELLFSRVNPGVRTVTPNFTIFYAQIPYRSVQVFNIEKASTGQLGNSERGPFIWLPWSEVLIAAKEYRAQMKAKVSPKVKLNKKYLIKGSQTDWYFNAFLATVKSISETSQNQLDGLKLIGD